MREQLNMAGRFGLELQQSLEVAQRSEQQSYAQIQALQDENLMLQARAHHNIELSSHLTGSEDKVKDLTDENESLQRELDGCRRELNVFRKEFDGLIDQMAQIGTEVVDAKNKAATCSRRLNEVEQELRSSQEMNVNLQEQIKVTLERQKQAQMSTAQTFKSIQTEIGKVITDSGSIRSTLEELENRQDKCEVKVVEMVSNTKEYAHLLEEAQTTIQTMRIESDMEGRGWNHHSPQGRKITRQLSTLAMEDPELEPSEELDPDGWNDDEPIPAGMSLGMELGHGMAVSNEGWTDHPEQEAQSKESSISSPLSTPTCSKPLTPAASPQAPVIVQNPEPIPTVTSKPVAPKQEREKEQKQQRPTAHIPKEHTKSSTTSISSELQRRLEKHNTLQTAMSMTSSSRPPWNPSVSLENMLPTPTQNRSRSSSRAASVSSRGSSRSVSQVNMRHLGSASSSLRNNQGQRQNTMPSPQGSPPSKSSSSSSSVVDTISASKRGSSKNNTQSRPRSRTTAATVERNPAPSSKSLVSSNGGTTNTQSGRRNTTKQ
ncbi:hypothetical protein BGZ51_003777 [Haplosporangium sp. Z 767]|nr:hypothetical protein BGZ51_003777 [Haplosporangium sp. Z 767]KAF9193781.1 hypothetical protein BGZ50_007074 [Haplosporangium sp. Z 11]